MTGSLHLRSLGREALRILVGREASVLAVIGYGVDRPDFLDPAIPFAAVAMPDLTRDTCFEVWTRVTPAVPADRHGFAVAEAGGLLFGTFAAEQGRAGLREVTRDAYARLFTMLGAEWSMVRLWNYLPAITAVENGAERYHSFNQGRAEAFRAAGFAGRPPAASALGTADGALHLLVLASRQAGTPIENPRQVSAYDYPRRYGPISPTFSRSMLHETGFFVSGTASIIGHQSMHPGDVVAQTAETCENLRLLRAAAESRVGVLTAAPTLKAYLLHPEHLPLVRTGIAQAFPSAEGTVFLQAQICRPELLVEVEAVWLR